MADVRQEPPNISYRDQLFQRDPLDEAPLEPEERTHAMPLGDWRDKKQEEEREHDINVRQQLQRRGLPPPTDAPEPDIEFRRGRHIQRNQLVEAGNVRSDASPSGFDYEGARKAGYSDEEITAYLSRKHQPIVSEAYLDRIRQGSEQSKRLMDAAFKGAKEGFGSQPLGIEPGSETEQWLNQHIFKGPLRLFNEATMRPAAVAIDAIMRGGSAFNRGIAEIAGQFAEEAGENKAMADRLRRDIDMMADVAQVSMGLDHFSRITHDPVTGVVHDEPIGGFPTDKDFDAAAKVVTAGDNNRHVRQNLERMYAEEGKHPAEVVGDAQRDIIARQEALERNLKWWSRFDTIPERTGPRAWTEHRMLEDTRPFRALETELDEKYGAIVTHSEDPLQRALSVATADTWGRDLAENAVQWAVENGRDDIARAIALRARQDIEKREDAFRMAGEDSKKQALKESEHAQKIYDDIQKIIDKGRQSEEGGEDLPRILGGGKGGGPLPPSPRDTSGQPPSSGSEGGGGIAGGGGRGGPPGPPGEPPPEEPFRRGGSSPSLRLAEDEILKRMSIGEAERKRPPMDVYTATVDKLWPIKRKVEEAKKAGVELPVAEDPYIASRLYSGWVGKAEVALRYEGPFGFFDYENKGPPLARILKPVQDELNSFRAFLGAARAGELENMKNIESGMPMDAAETVVRAAPTKYKDAMRQIIDYQNSGADYLRDAQVLSRAGAAALKQSNKFYIPFFRIMDEEGIGLAPNGQSLQAKNPIKRIEGSERRIVDPLESIIKNTYVFRAMAERNVVGLKFVAMMREMERIRAELRPTAGRDLALRPVQTTLPVEFDDSLRNHLREMGLTHTLAERRGGVPGTHLPEHPGVTQLHAMIKEMAAPLAEDEIRVFEDGKAQRYKVDIDIARAFKGLDAATVGTWEKLAAPFARTLRAGAVLSPEFSVRHLIRDTIYAFTTYEHGIFTPFDTAKGLAGVFVKDQDFIDWLKAGGGQVTLVSMDRKYLQRTLEDLTSHSGVMSRAFNAVSHPLDSLAMVTDGALSATHLGAFKKRMRQLEEMPGERGSIRPAMDAASVDEALEHYENQRLGRFDIDQLPALRGADLRVDAEHVDEAMRAFGYHVEDGTFIDIVNQDAKSKIDKIEAAWTARNTSVDMGRMGAKMRAWNMISAFWNAKIQDTDRVFRAIKDNPGRTAALIGLGITAPSVVLWAVNHDDTRYKELQDWEKDSYWIWLNDKWENATPEQAAVRPADQIRLYNGQLQTNNGAIWRIPKPFNAGVVFGSGVERLLDAYATEKVDGLKGWVDSLLANTVGDMLPNAVTPVLEQATNQSRLSGRKVVPSNLEGMLPEYKYAPYTTEFAKKLAMGASELPGMHNAQRMPWVGGVANAVTNPMLIENYVRAWSGTLGSYMLRTADLALRKMGKIPDPPGPVSQLADIPFIRAFTIRHPTASVKSVEDFYSAVDEVTTLQKTWQHAAQSGDQEAMERVQAIGGNENFINMQDTKKAIGVLTDLIRRTNQMSDIKPEEKRQLIDQYYFGIQMFARTGNEMIGQLRQELKKGQQP